MTKQNNKEKNEKRYLRPSKVKSSSIDFESLGSVSSTESLTPNTSLDSEELIMNEERNEYDAVSSVVDKICDFYNGDNFGIIDNTYFTKEIEEMTQRPSKKKESKEKYDVGVYYYPWHAREFHGRQYLREKLDPPQLPALGEYSDRDCKVIGQHLVWSHKASINLWVTSWWGKGRKTDITTRDHILKNPFLGDMKIAIHYETKARTKFNSTSEPFGYLGHIESDFEYLAETYFSHPNYHTITTTETTMDEEGNIIEKITTKPVVVIYLARSLESRGILGNVTEIMRNTTKRYGFDDVYIVGDYNFGPFRRKFFWGMEYLDAITNYDIYGSIQVIHQEAERQGKNSTVPAGYAGRDAVEEYLIQQKKWKNRALIQNASYIPSVTPGYNDMGVRPQEGHTPLSRKIDPESEFGSLFELLLNGAMRAADPSTGNMILINSFNEWHEDTQIEPVSSGFVTNRFVNSTKQYNFTEGVHYEAYGETYLDILARRLNP